MEKVFPLMVVIYFFLGISVLLMNATEILVTFKEIFRNTFEFQAIMGGAVGWTFKQIMDSMQKGIACRIFTKEVGLGSSPIAASAAKSKEPV